MLQSFLDRSVEDVFNRINSREVRRTCLKQLWTVARRKLDQLNAAVFALFGQAKGRSALKSLIITRKKVL